jgi:hypothetical protein
MAERQERFLVDARGRKTAVVMPLVRYRRMVEDLHDLAVVAERRDEVTIPLDDVIARLKRDGLLRDSLEDVRLP